MVAEVAVIAPTDTAVITGAGAGAVVNVKFADVADAPEALVDKAAKL